MRRRASIKRVLNADLDSSKKDRDENIQANNLLHKTTFNDLTASQVVEWEHIGEAIFSWSCGRRVNY